MIKTNQFRLLTVTKDGGEESRVWAYWLFAWKPLFSIGFLRFEDGTRDAYHSHAFDCVSWVLSGGLREDNWGAAPRTYAPSLRPVITRRSTMHRVRSVGRTWVLTLRGPWSSTWREAVPVSANGGAYRQLVLTHGRKEVLS
jgi:hypothetical protein